MICVYENTEETVYTKNLIILDTQNTQKTTPKYTQKKSRCPKFLEIVHGVPEACPRGRAAASVSQ